MEILGFGKKRSRIASFFEIDIDDIFGYEPAFVTEYRQEEFKVEVYELDLSPKELGVFDKVTVRRFPQDYSLQFTGACRQFSPEVLDLVRAMVKRYGPDTAGGGVITLAETEKAAEGVSVSRIWANGNMVNLIDGRLSLLLWRW